MEIKMSGTVGSVLKRKGSEVWFVTPDQTVYEGHSKNGRKGSGSLARDFGRQTCGHHLGARLRPEGDPQRKIFQDNPGQGDHDEPSDYRDP